MAKVAGPPAFLDKPQAAGLMPRDLAACGGRGT
jgi:hypothetical protein